jgi:hypothetical protein
MREMRKNNRQMTQAETESMLESGEYGFLAVMGDENYPYAVPLSYAYENGVIYFHSAKEGHKLDGMRGHSKVSFSLVGKTEVLPGKFSTKYESVIVFGQAVEIEGEEKRIGLMALIRKYSPDFLEKGGQYVSHSEEDTIVVKIIIDHMTGKARR